MNGAVQVSDVAVFVAAHGIFLGALLFRNVIVGVLGVR